MTTASAPTSRIRRAGAGFRWPNDKRVALVFNIAFEAWSDGEAPGIGPMGNVLKPGYFDTNAHSWASYGAVRGIQRLARIANANGIRTSVMTNGVLAQKHPDIVADLWRDGHEIVAHSWGMDVIPVYLDAEAELANLRRTSKAIHDACGETPSGWISPRGTGSFSSPALLSKDGYLWQGDCNDDDLPAIVEFASGERIVNIPLTMDVNDLPHSIRYGNQPADLVAHFEDVLDGTADADGAPFMLDVTAHAHVYGRPAGAWAFDAMMRIASDRDDVVIMTRREITDHVLAAPAGWFA